MRPISLVEAGAARIDAEVLGRMTVADPVRYRQTAFARVA
jgi:hypothetical protein